MILIITLIMTNDVITMILIMIFVLW